LKYKVSSAEVIYHVMNFSMTRNRYDRKQCLLIWRHRLQCGWCDVTETLCSITIRM